MTYNELRNAFHEFAVFSTKDVVKLFPDFDSRRLVEWQQKGYIKKLINKWYLFSNIEMDENIRYRIGNCLCRPSYVSLESALWYYGFIPEGVYTIQSITTRKTIQYETSAGSFQYRSLKSHLFFGYNSQRSNRLHVLPVMIADPEKAVLDFLYLNPRITSMSDMEGLRFNTAALNDIINWGKFTKYAACFESATLNKRISLLKKIGVHADII